MQIVFPVYVDYNCINLVIKKAMEMFFIEMNNEGKFYKLDKFLYNTLGSNIRCIDILLYATRNAYVGKYMSKYVLDMTNKTFYKNTNYTVSSLIMLINSGNLEVKGTNAIVYCYNHIRNHLKTLCDIYTKKYRR